MAKKTVPQYRTPRGIAVYPRLNAPDTKYNKHGNYKANVRVGLAEAKPTIASIQEVAKRHIGKALPVKKNACFEYEVDAETGEETGNIIFKLVAKNRMVKDKRSGEEKLWDRRPKLFSASGKPANKAKVGGGSEYAVVFEIYEGKDGDGKPIMNLQPVAVQIYKLVEFGSAAASAADYGIEAEEGWEPEEDDAYDGDDSGSEDEGGSSGSDDSGSSDSEMSPGEEDF